MNIFPGTSFRPRVRRAAPLRRASVFLLGVLVGLLLALWWRALQLQRVPLPPYHEANSGIRPERVAPAGKKSAVGLRPLSPPYHEANSGIRPE